MVFFYTIKAKACQPSSIWEERRVYQQKALHSRRTPQSVFVGQWGQEPRRAAKRPSVSQGHAQALTLLWSRNQPYPLSLCGNTSLCPVVRSRTQEPGTPGRFSPTSSTTMTPEPTHPQHLTHCQSPSCSKGLSEWELWFQGSPVWEPWVLTTCRILS